MEQASLCERISRTLASAPIHDHLGYEALAYLKLPGPHYYQVLRGLHKYLQPQRYIEIGVRDGRSLELALPETQCIGIDPSPRWTPMRGNVSLAIMSSDAFFASPAVDRGCQFDLAFIDGDHSFAQALRDFANLERHAKANSVIVLHDVIPMDERTAAPIAQTAFHTGEIWRLMAALVHKRSDLTAFTLACPPTGLGVVLNFQPDQPDQAALAGLSDVEEEWALGLPFTECWDEWVARLRIVPNDPAAIAAVLER